MNYQDAIAHINQLLIDDLTPITIDQSYKDAVEAIKSRIALLDSSLESANKREREAGEVVTMLLSLITDVVRDGATFKEEDLKQVYEDWGVNSPWRVDVDAAITAAEELLANIEYVIDELSTAKNTVEDTIGALENYKDGYDESLDDIEKEYGYARESAMEYNVDGYGTKLELEY